MRWKRHYRKHQSTARTVFKKLERREKMAKVNPQKSSHSKKPKVERQELPAEKQFVLHSGTRLKDIEELARLMDHMDESDFSFHVTAEKNDFANWVRGVFNEEQLADELVAAKDRKHCHIALLRHVAFGKK
ncbi:TPA: hypothetical protein HA265_05280 [Candidatus Woesearchaeota archaeon]|nr:hypothetical protein [Candidatus Woesearchaeota archaeon]